MTCSKHTEFIRYHFASSCTCSYDDIMILHKGYENQLLIQERIYISRNSHNLHLFAKLQNRLVYLLSVMLLNWNNPFLRLR